MDTNEIDLDEFDKSDISSDWDSSEDEAPAMEIEDVHELTEERMNQLNEIATQNIPKEASDSDGEGEVIPRTEHEVSEDYVEVEEITETLDTNAMLIKAGFVSHILEDSYVIDAGKNAKAIEENTVLYKQDMHPIGRVSEVFGQVEHPFYTLRWPKSMSNPNLIINDIVYVNNTTIQYILPAQLNNVGTDASNLYDEEPSEKERMFVECTEDLKGGEIQDESTLLEEPVNYNRDYVIPPNQPKPSFYPMVSQSVLPPPSQPKDTSGMDILRNSYF